MHSLACKLCCVFAMKCVFSLLLVMVCVYVCVWLCVCMHVCVGKYGTRVYVFLHAYVYVENIIYDMILTAARYYQWQAKQKLCPHLKILLVYLRVWQHISTCATLYFIILHKSAFKCFFYYLWKSLIILRFNMWSRVHIFNRPLIIKNNYAINFYLIRYNRAMVIIYMKWLIWHPRNNKTIFGEETAIQKYWWHPAHLFVLC